MQVLIIKQSCWKIQQHFLKQLQLMHTALDIGTHFVAGQKVAHLTSSYHSYNSFIF